MLPSALRSPRLASARATSTRGFHSSTSQLNVRRVWLLNHRNHAASPSKVAYVELIRGRGESPTSTHVAAGVSSAIDSRGQDTEECRVTKCRRPERLGSHNTSAQSVRARAGLTRYWLASDRSDAPPTPMRGLARTSCERHGGDLLLLRRRRAGAPAACASRGWGPRVRPRDSDNDSNTVSPLLDLVERFPVLFAQKVPQHLDPIDRTYIAQAGSACRVAVVASDLPRAGWSRLEVGNTVWQATHVLREFCTSVERLAWAKASGCPWVARTCALPARDGYLHVLRWAREHGCPWDEGTCAWAAKGGHLELLQWAREHGCPWDQDTCAWAAVGWHLEVLQWARAHHCRWGKWTCTHAAEGGHLEVLRWAREHQCHWLGYTYLFPGSCERAPGGAVRHACTRCRQEVARANIRWTTRPGPSALAHGSSHEGQGESLVPPHTRGSVCLFHTRCRRVVVRCYAGESHGARTPIWSGGRGSTGAGQPAAGAAAAAAEATGEVARWEDSPCMWLSPPFRCHGWTSVRGASHAGGTTPRNTTKFVKYKKHPPFLHSHVHSLLKPSSSYRIKS